MTESFIANARARLTLIRAVLDSRHPLNSAEAAALVRLAEAAVESVAADGSLPAALCTAVVKYGAKKP